jgi:hypothetical protein
VGIIAFSILEVLMPVDLAFDPIAEQTTHVFSGEFPVVETYPEIDTDLLYEDDTKLGVRPFHITLAIAEIGTVSQNGLIYDEELVNTIAEQLRGRGGVRGHVPKDQMGSAYPLDAVNWIGHKMVDNRLWAKGYIPPGETRGDLRRKMATKGQVGTSVFGKAIREQVSAKQWRAKNFQLDSVDLAPPARAAMLVNDGQFTITSETSNTPEEEEIDSMPTITLQEVPQDVREQIIREAQVHADAGRVTELETQISEFEGQVAELEIFRPIVVSLRQLLRDTTSADSDGEIVSTIEEMSTTLTGLRTVLGEEADIVARVTEMHTNIIDLQEQTFQSGLTTTLAEFTSEWQNISEEKSKKKVAALESQFRRAVVSEIGEERGEEQISEVSQRVWDEEFKVLAETLRDALAGPGAFVGGGNNNADWEPSDSAEARAKAGF